MIRLDRTKTPRVGTFTLKMQGAATAAVATYLSAFVLVAPGCGDNDSDGGAGVHAFDTSSCAEGLSGEAKEAEQAGVVRGYAWKVTADGAEVALRGEGGASLGTVKMDAIVEAPSGELVGRARLQVSGDEVASQRLKVRRLGGGRVAVRADNVLGENKSALWILFDAEGQVERLTVGAQHSGGEPYPDDVKVDLDGAHKTFDVVTDGKPADEAAIKKWVADNLGDFEEDPHWALLLAGANGEGWLRQAEGQARLCSAGEAQTAAGRLTSKLGISSGALSQGLSSTCSALSLSASGGIASQRYAQSCGGDDPLAVYQRIANVLGAVGFVMGVAIALTAATGAGVAAGVGIVGFAVLSKLVAPKVVEWYVKERKGHVVSRLGQLGNLLAGGSGERNEAFEDFFGGGGGSSSGGGGGGGNSGGGKVAGSSGDPHLDTFDGLAYDFQGAGEFVLARARLGSSNRFEIQARQQALSSSKCPNVSFNTAVAARVGSDRVTFTGGSERPLRVNGKQVDVAGGLLALPGGGAITGDRLTYVVRWPTGEAMQVLIGGSARVRVGLPQARRGQVEGLLGNFNGETSDDLARADGTILAQPAPWDVLVSGYADDWRVTAETSLFDYADGEDTSTFTVEGFPGAPAKVEGLPAADRAAAETACASITNEVAKADCVLDVGCTGDSTFVVEHEDRSPAARLELDEPVFLSDWQQQGKVNNGNWVVSEDGRSVNQTLNGSPSFFVSSGDHFEQVIRGRLRSDGGDDDYIGFVFGFSGPQADKGDAEDEFHTWLLAWKGGDQGNAPGGLTLVRLDGVVNTSGSGPFWTQASDETYRVAATSHAANLGWQSKTDYDFELHYTKARVIIRINGATVFDLSASDAGVAEFTPGRFGFYNFSQPNVTYSRFSAAPAKAQPTLNPVAQAGLVAHFDAAKGVAVDGSAVTSWSGGSGAVLTAPSADQRPTLVPGAVAGSAAVRFDGVDDLLERLGAEGTEVAALSVFAVVAPTKATGNFDAIASATSADNQHDYATGFHVDLGGQSHDDGQCSGTYVDPLDAFNTVNLGSAKWSNGHCGLDYFEGSLPLGGFYLLTVELGPRHTLLRVDGQEAGFKNHGLRTQQISLADLRIGARYHKGETQGFFNGDVAELVIYRRPLTILERDALETHLLAKYALAP